MSCRHVGHCAALIAALVAVSCSSGPRQDDRETRMIDATLERVAETPPDRYDPGAVIDAVNALHALGKDEALLAVERRADEANDVPYGLFWVLRTLFDVPPDRGFPPVRLGQPDIPAPAQPQRLPRFPVMIVNDVPLLAVRGYSLGGMPEPVQAHVDYFRAEGELRASPLSRPSSREGIEDAAMEAWRDAYGDAHAGAVAALVREQLARMGL